MRRLGFLAAVLVTVSFESYAFETDPAVMENRCRHGHAVQCNQVAEIYFKGLKVNPDLRKALRLYRNACHLLNGEGCYRSADMIRRGQGTKSSDANAFKYFKMGCELNDAQSCMMVSRYKSMGMDDNDSKTPDDYMKAAANAASDECGKGHGRGCFALGKLYSMEQGPLKRNMETSMMLWKKACAKGVTEACEELGYIYLYGSDKVKPLPSRAESMFTQSCSQNGGTGCAQLGFIYQYGEGGFAQDLEKARAYFKRSCRMNTGVGCHFLGKMYQQGLGVTADARQAKMLFGMGCELGYDDSCKYGDKTSDAK